MAQSVKTSPTKQIQVWCHGKLKPGKQTMGKCSQLQTPFEWVCFLKKDYFLMDVEAFYFKGLGFGYFK